MWSRELLKSLGKQNFKRVYGKAVIVCLIVTIVSSLFGNNDSSGVSTSYEESYNYEVNVDSGEEILVDESIVYYTGNDSGFNVSVGGWLGGTLTNTVKNSLSEISIFIMGIAMFAIMAISILVSIFIVNPIIIGKNNFFMGIRENDRNVGDVFFLFNKWKFIKPSVTMFFVDLYTILWTFCLIIPGIIKAYEYFMIQYILCENPDIDRKRAFEISRKMMDGQKMDVFVLDLSFIGWYLVSAFTIGIAGVFYVNPYVEATYAELYAVLRENALREGYANEEELPGF